MRQLFFINLLRCKISNLYIITDPAGIGKSTISKKIAKLKNKSVFDIYHQVIGGYISAWKIRGNGIGKSLLEKIEEYYKRINIEVFGPNKKGLNFYEKNDYIISFQKNIGGIS